MHVTKSNLIPVKVGFQFEFMLCFCWISAKIQTTVHHHYKNSYFDQKLQKFFFYNQFTIFCSNCSNYQTFNLPLALNKCITKSGQQKQSGKKKQLRDNFPFISDLCSIFVKEEAHTLQIFTVEYFGTQWKTVRTTLGSICHKHRVHLRKK